MMRNVSDSEKGSLLCFGSAVSFDEANRSCDLYLCPPGSLIKLCSRNEISAENECETSEAVNRTFCPSPDTTFDRQAKRLRG